MVKVLVREKPSAGKLNFVSVLTQKAKETGPFIPGVKEFDVPTFAKGEEYTTKPDPKKQIPGELKFSPLTILAEELPKVRTYLGEEAWKAGRYEAGAELFEKITTGDYVEFLTLPAYALID